MKKGSRTFDSMTSAAAALGVSREVIAAAKNSGECIEAFHGSRVIEQPLLRWISANSDKVASQAVTLKDKKVAEEIRKLKLKNDKDEGKLVPRAAVAESIRKVSGPINFLIDQKLENEYPSAVAGLDVPQARIYGKRLADSIKEEFQKLFTAWEI